MSTSVEGTRWLTLDECNSSRVKVAEGIVVVHDLIHNTTITLSAGQEYAATAPSEEGTALVPGAGRVYFGVTGGSVSGFQGEVGKHPALYGYFATWNGSLGTPLAAARANHTRLFIHISTDRGYGGGVGEVISPGAIAHGNGGRLPARPRRTAERIGHAGLHRVPPRDEPGQQMPTARSAPTALRAGASGDVGFVKQFFAFVRSHRRVGLIVYNQGLNSNGPFRLKHFPGAKSEIRRQLRSSRFLAVTHDSFARPSEGSEEEPRESPSETRRRRVTR